MTILRNILTFVTIATSINVHAQENNIEYLPFGDMNNWIKRKVVESRVIGGKEKTLNEIAKGDPITVENLPYVNINNSPWATSNVYAHIAIVHKGVCNVKPEKHDNNGYCAMMETTLEDVKVLGLFHLRVIATGTIFLGEMIEPITSTDNANQYLDRGIPFTKKPKSLVFDYSLKNVPKRMYASGMGQPKEIEGTNGAEVVAILHKRWEDSDGNIYAKRVGIIWKRLFDMDGEWKDRFEIPFYYGDYSKTQEYAPYMKLESNDDPKTHTLYARNSRGVVKPIVEVGWGTKDEMPTHLVLSFSSGWGGAYMGSPGTKFAVDNVGFIN